MLLMRCKHCWLLMKFHRLASVRYKCAAIRGMEGSSWGEAMTDEELEMVNTMMWDDENTREMGWPH